MMPDRVYIHGYSSDEDLLICFATEFAQKLVLPYQQEHIVQGYIRDNSDDIATSNNMKPQNSKINLGTKPQNPVSAPHRPSFLRGHNLSAAV